MNTDNVQKAGKAARERSEAASNWALDANKSNGWAYIGESIPAAYSKPFNDELDDEPPHQSVLNDLLDFAKGSLILAVCFGLCGFVYGRYFI